MGSREAALTAGGRIRAGRARLVRVVLAGAVGAAAVGAAAACTSTSAPAAARNAAAEGGGPVASGAADSVQQQYQDVVKAVLPSVVEIITTSATGSGVVYDDKGDIVTNAHVVGNAQTVHVQTSSDKSALTAKVVGAFTPDDLAVVRVTSDAGSLRKATFASSSPVTAGQIVLAMGSPLGLSGTVTQGIISATGRTVTESSTASGQTASTIVDALQTSAAINSGNSGGALVNLAGQVIGIPTAAAQNPSSGSQAAGIGFAIPSDTVTKIADQLIATGKVSNSGRAALGITARNYVSSSGQAGGVQVVTVTSDGPAERAGIRAGDVITGVNGDQATTQAALTAILATLTPGEKVPVQYSRDGSMASTTVTLGTLSS